MVCPTDRIRSHDYLSHHQQTTGSKVIGRCNPHIVSKFSTLHRAHSLNIGRCQVLSPMQIPQVLIPYITRIARLQYKSTLNIPTLHLRSGRQQHLIMAHHNRLRHITMAEEVGLGSPSSIMANKGKCRLMVLCVLLLTIIAYL